MMAFRFLRKSVWQTKVPLRAAFLTQSVTLGKIFTMVNLKKRHVTVVNRYCMCKKNGESMDHILLYYEVACATWNVFFSQFGLSLIMPRQVVDLYAYW
jgi:hypothetical protein